MPARVRFTVDFGAPEYGPSLDPEVLSEEPEPDVKLDVELPEQSWRPLAPDPATRPVESVLFSDGVQRIDAHIWIPDGDETRAGVCASYAAGVVRCAEAAEVEETKVRRAVLTSAAIEAIQLGRSGIYQTAAIASDTPDNVRRELQRLLRDLEVSVIKEATTAELVVVDGHLRGREDVAGALGYVKSHQSSYLQGGVRGVVGRLAPGERTPVFLIQSSWSRYSFYLRLLLPDGAHRAVSGHPWSGIVRCELASSLTAAEAIRRANLASVTLPRYSSAPYKDPRAPQNLYPIGGLEKRLRHRSETATWCAAT